MDLSLSIEDQEFREAARTWLEAHVPREPRPTDVRAACEFDRAWQRTQYEGGWAGISWPAEYGGRGATLIQQLIWYEQYALAGAPWAGCCFVGLSHAGPTLISHGTDTQRRAHLPPILRGDEIWCQGFSEPGAGSDLAALTTKGEVDGDELVVTGQKIWTSFAQVADFQELLVRTDPRAPRHQGLTWIICDMRSEGIEVRPIRTMARTDDFAAVFYDAVRIPLDQVVGGLGQGWKVAMSTLGYERGTAFIADQVRLARTVEDLIEEARQRTDHRGRPLIDDDHTAHVLATLRAEAAALRAMTYAMVSRYRAGQPPGPEGSIVRLYYAELVQRVHESALDIVGPATLEFTADGWSGRWLWHHAETIGGGTAEIQRNIVGERLLGLPR